MENKPQHCKQCGREIYFDGICANCRAENEKNKILAFTEDEINAKIGSPPCFKIIFLSLVRPPYIATNII